MATSKFRLKTDGDKIILNPVVEKPSINLQINVKCDGNLIKARTDYFKQFDEFFELLNTSIQSMSTTEKNVNQIFCACEELVTNYDKLIKSMIPTEIYEQCSKVFDTAKRFVIDKFKTRNTAKKRHKIIERDESHVKSTKSAIGLTWKSQMICGNDLPSHELKQTTYELISITEILESLFKNDHFYQNYFDFNENRKHMCTEGVYEDFCCGSIFRANRVFTRTTIQLQLGIDEFEPCCALKTKAGLHKMCGIYLEIRNMDPKLKSKLSNIHLVALAKSNDIKCGGFDRISRKIVDELKALETTGINVKHSINLKAILINISCDNLGANSVHGFVESFAATYFCRICELSLSESQKTVQEIIEKIRRKSDYALILDDLAENGDRQPDYKLSKGIKKPCIFNELKYYHMFDNCTVDVMHDLCEGVIPFFLKKLFQYIVQMKIARFVNDLQALCRDYSYGWIWKKYKPSNINIEKDNLNQNAMQSYCLLLHIPFILFEFRSKLESTWNAIEVLLQLVQIVFSSRIQENDRLRLKDLVQKHLSYLIESGALLIRKHHNMTHYANLILKIGPLIHSWMMRFESKHKVFTDMVRLTNNYKNLQYSLTKRHQERVLLNRNMAFRTKIEASKITYDISKCNGFEIYQSHLLHFTCDSLPRGLKFIRDGPIDYRPGLFFIHRNVIHEIIHVFFNTEKYYTLCQQHEAVCFANHFNSIEIKRIENLFNIFNILEINCLKTYDCIHYDNKKYIIADTLDVHN